MDVQPNLSPLAAPAANLLTLIVRRRVLLSINGPDHLIRFGIEVIQHLILKCIAFMFVCRFHGALLGRPGGVAGAAEAIIQKPFDFVVFGLKINFHHVIHELVSMRFKEHRHTGFTMPLFAELG